VTAQNHDHDERVDALVNDNTRAALHALATQHGWTASDGNKRALASYVATSEHLANNGETPDETPDVNNDARAGVNPPKQNDPLTRENVVERTRADVALLVERATGERPANTVSKRALVNVLFPPPTVAVDGLVTSLAASCPVLVSACDAVLQHATDTLPDVGVFVTRCDVVHVAALVVDDCRLRDNPHAASRALHVRTSGQHRRLTTVVRRLVATTFVTQPRHVRSALLGAVVPALALAFPNTPDGALALGVLFAETADAFPCAGAVTSPVAAPVDETHGQPV
jgi:hypothetical protein